MLFKNKAMLIRPKTKLNCLKQKRVSLIFNHKVHEENTHKETQRLILCVLRVKLCEFRG